ncbi:MAG: LLM class flavin-dependent oxidoreductase [Chloroflexota bacterium]|nr:LLM class flavin-dependent oxidoreductase [Chloroflexota bacterium]
MQVSRKPAPARRGFGVAGALPKTMIRELSAVVEAAGYDTFWVNDTPDGDGLAALATAAESTKTIRLGVGVIPLDRQSAEHIAARMRELDLPADRLTLGLGSGRGQGGLDRVRSGATSLRAASNALIVIGALGPKMCHVAGEVSDGVLLNWLTPGYAATTAELVVAAAAAADRPRPYIAGYVRSAIGSEAQARFRQEGDRYASFPAYGAHFARMEAAPWDTGVVGETGAEIKAGLRRFDSALDEVVVRAIVANDALDAYRELIEAAAPSH